jgi:MFS family permease
MPAPPYRFERLQVALLATAQALFSITAITVMTLSGLVGAKLASNPSYTTLPIAAMMLGTLLTTLPASILMQRLGRRAGFLLGASLGGVTGGGLSLVAIAGESFWLFCFASLLLGFYQGFAMYYRFAAADVVREAWRSRAIALVLSGGVVAAVLGPLNVRATLEWLPAIPAGGPYAVIILLSLLATSLLALLRVPAIPPAAEEKPARPWRVIITQPTYRVAVIAAAVGYAVMMMLMTATPLAMREAGFLMGDIAMVMQWHVLGMFLPSFVTGSLIFHLGVDRVLIIGVVLMFSCIAIAAAEDSLIHFSVALVLLGVGWNFLYVAGSSLLTTTYLDNERGISQGINDLLVNASVVAGSLLAGVLLHSLGWRAINLISLLPLIFALLAILYWRRQGTQRESGGRS